MLNTALKVTYSCLVGGENSLIWCILTAAPEESRGSGWEEEGEQRACSGSARETARRHCCADVPRWLRNDCLSRRDLQV